MGNQIITTQETSENRAVFNIQLCRNRHRNREKANQLGPDWLTTVLYEDPES